MADVVEWPKWLNDVLTKLDNSSAEVGPSAMHASALISPTLRKELRDHCIELHQCHTQRKTYRLRAEALEATLRELVDSDDACTNAVGDEQEVASQERYERAWDSARKALIK